MINKIAVIGLGNIGKIHLKLLNENPKWNVAGIFDTDHKLCKELAAQYNTRVFSNLEDAIQNSEVIDIATPGKSHFEIAKQAIINGRHVFVQKPVSSTIKEAKQLHSYIKEAGIFFQVSHVERFNPAYIAAKPYLKDPKFIEINRLAPYNFTGTDTSVIFDLIMPDLDLLLNMVKANVKKTHVSGTSLVSKNVDVINARIEFENGVVANITANRMTFKNSRKLNAFTNDNYISINLLDKITEVVSVKNAGINSKNYMIDPGKGLPKKEMFFEHPIILPTNAINEELNALHNGINSNKNSIIGIDEAIRVLELAAEIEEKLRT